MSHDKINITKIMQFIRIKDTPLDIFSKFIIIAYYYALLILEYVNIIKFI